MNAAMVDRVVIVHRLPNMGLHPAVRFVLDLAEVLDPGTVQYVLVPTAAIGDLPFDVFQLQAKGIRVCLSRPTVPHLYVVHGMAKAGCDVNWHATPYRAWGISVRSHRRHRAPQPGRTVVGIVPADDECPVACKLLADLPPQLEPMIPHAAEGSPVWLAAEARPQGVHRALGHADGFPEIMRACDVFVRCSVVTWPQLLLRAAAMGIPVMAPADSLTELMSRCPPQSRDVHPYSGAEDALTQIRAIVHDRHGAAQLGANAKLWAANYDIHLLGGWWRRAAIRESYPPYA